MSRADAIIRSAIAASIACPCCASSWSMNAPSTFALDRVLARLVLVQCLCELVEQPRVHLRVTDLSFAVHALEVGEQARSRRVDLERLRRFARVVEVVDRRHLDGVG